MSRIIMIAAIGKNRELGKDNNLIWYLKEDLKFFKEKTMGHKIVMGYNTFSSLPKVLPGRVHLVLTHKNLEIDNVQSFNDFNELLAFINSLEEDVYVIGGASVYRLFMPYADELLLTEVESECVSADVYFPKLNEEEYDKEVLYRVEEEIPYKHVKYKRKL